MDDSEGPKKESFVLQVLELNLNVRIDNANCISSYNELLMLVVVLSVLYDDKMCPDLGPQKVGGSPVSNPEYEGHLPVLSL